MSDVRYNEVTAEEIGQRLDNYLIRVLKGVPKSFIYRIIRSGEVRINKKRAQAASRLEEGDLIRIPPVRTAGEKTVIVSEKFEQRLKECILYEDSHLLVINKPSGIAVHGGSGVSLGVIEAFRKTRPDLPYLELVHRLDKETSGCLVLAKKRSMLRSIQALLETRQIKKTYWAILVNPWIGKKETWVEAPLLKNNLKSGERMVVISQSGKPSKTQFKLIENFHNACWVEVNPETGRTHQIRVHSAFLGNPIVGDPKYGQTDKVSNERLYLHARAIEFNLEGKVYRFEASTDNKFNDLISKLHNESQGHL